MGHRVDRPADMFDSVRYNIKTTPEIRAAMQKKVKEIASNIEEREARMRRIREEYQIDAERLATLVIQFQNNDSGFVSYQAQGDSKHDVVVPAGVIANIIREREMIDSERGQIRKMELILRNIPDMELYNDLTTGEVKSRQPLHKLSDEELEFLGY
ncbi:hypothetical protein [Nannocystis bainbridge]|uniref:Terminase small subunit n=1 Tax=Nannocystis bainbridge TaxID=2995303 RepID=A0ABT5DUT8_9BACT|nr:hypothetical protein [Nannocystis bainbridge]MDC0716176.1 hypothetical protein [Nannocystis bainbridge]